MNEVYGHCPHGENMVTCSQCNPREITFEKIITIETLLEFLSLHGGEIVSTSSLDTNSINQARASGRMYVDENSLGYVWIPDINKLPETDEEVMFFEKWYPLDVEMPEELKNWRPWMPKIKKP